MMVFIPNRLDLQWWRGLGVLTGLIMCFQSPSISRASLTVTQVERFCRTCLRADTHRQMRCTNSLMLWCLQKTQEWSYVEAFCKRPGRKEVVEHARLLLDAYRGLGARDALHAAVAMEYGLESICSYDLGFDELSVRRIEPTGILNSLV